MHRFVKFLSFQITKVPQAPHFICGVINLRGRVVPVVDMRLKFRMEKSEKTVNTCIVVVEVDFEGENVTLGALVDSVQEVLELGPPEIEPAPKIGIKFNTDFINGMEKRDAKFIILLNINQVFCSEELSLVQQNQKITEEIAV